MMSDSLLPPPKPGLSGTWVGGWVGGGKGEGKGEGEGEGEGEGAGGDRIKPVSLG